MQFSIGRIPFPHHFVTSLLSLSDFKSNWLGLIAMFNKTITCTSTPLMKKDFNTKSIDYI